MSADNQVEPVAAMAAAAATSGSAPGSASEYLKRTCLICGCQTNQTINIYEPRSGPNIVQLIQAKFKFQPLNEDKFLCFSCNNWLINWHSLQALNSNDANESQSQSRSQSPSHMGNNLVQQRQLQKEDPPMERARLRPVAQVRPQPQPQRQVPTQSPSPAQPQIQPATASAPVISYNKRCFASGRSSSSSHPARKMLRRCCVCGTPMVLRLISSSPAQTLSKLARRSGQRSQCRKCRESEIAKWRRLHKRSAAKVLQLQHELRQKKQQQKQQQINAREQTLVKVTLPYQRFQAPRVDGKVVAMFRRLGTTLSTEDQESGTVTKPTERPLRIMSPVKQRPRWTRQLDDDEILLEFDSVISEVLTATPTPQPTPLLTAARRRLCYQFTDEMEAETETVTEVELAEKAETKDNRKSVHKLTHQTHVNLAGLQLPQGLSITLI